MIQNSKAELLAILSELSPADAADVLLFARARLAQRKADTKPITAQEWDRLTFWQRKAIYWRARWFLYLDTHRERKSA